MSRRENDFCHVHKLDFFSFLKLRLVIRVRSRRSYLPYRLDSQRRCRKQKAAREGPAVEKLQARRERGLQSDFWPGWGRGGRQSPAALLRKASVTDTESSSDSMRGRAAKI